GFGPASNFVELEDLGKPSLMPKWLELDACVDCDRRLCGLCSTLSRT
ncbi:hypothetical protein A2U01_0118619, partial [Trifolium medium]|nr:hypothetical protein [Trifolium medium]